MRSTISIAGTLLKSTFSVQRVKKAIQSATMTPYYYTLATNVRTALRLASARPLYVLSPHLDDALWSMGGVLYALASVGHEITIINIFSLTVHVYESVRTPVEATLMRKSEDAAATKIAGIAHTTYLDFPDGVLRDMSLKEVMNPNYVVPRYLHDAIVLNLCKILPHDAMVLAPMALGGHVDHLATRQTALAIKQHVSSLLFYEDLPYVARGRDTEEALHFAHDQKLREERIVCTGESIEDHMRFYNMYESQRCDEYVEQIIRHLTTRGYGFWVSNH